jgi:glutathione peroxidase
MMRPVAQLRLIRRAVLALMAVFGLGGGTGVAAGAGCAPLLDHSFPALLTGKPQSLCQYSGKVVLVVNTASACGYTPQYEGLEALNKRYAARGLVVLGFPSNDFGGQEPGGNKEVAEFCQVNFGVTFQMFEKSSVSGTRANAFHAALAQRAGGPPQWNFHKYLIDRSGARVAGFASQVDPASPRFAREIERLLAQQ